MTASQLQSHPSVTALARIQSNLGLKDIQFANTIRLGIHGANWGKIKAGTYDGNYTAAATKLSVALEAYQNQGTGEAVEGIVVLDHVRMAKDAVDLALASEDEHRLVIISGQRGSGKSRTLSLLHSIRQGHSISALPSWSGGYLNFLNKFAAGIGVAESRSAGQAEDAILSALTESAGLITIDEFNYFSPSAINFLKSVLNTTRWAIAVATVPHYLSRMASDRQTSQEAAQLLRRASAIIHIPPVTARTVELVQRALYPEINVGGKSGAIASAANLLNRMDSVCAILADSESPEDIESAIARHKRFNQVTLKPGEE
jgi:DNA transposition AAA+ family ATPase